MKAKFLFVVVGFLAIYFAEATAFKQSHNYTEVDREKIMRELAKRGDFIKPTCQKNSVFSRNYTTFRCDMFEAQRNKFAVIKVIRSLLKKSCSINMTEYHKYLFVFSQTGGILYP